MRAKTWTKWVVVAGATVILASGCSAFKAKNESQPIDPPRDAAGPPGVADSAVPVSATSQTQQMQVTIYAKDKNGFVAPLTIRIDKTESVARKTLEYMVEGGPSQNVLPRDFTALLPKGTTVLGLDINKDKKIAVVDFSEQFTNYNVQDERKILEAVTWALTGFPGVDQVQIRVEGKTLDEMPQGGTPIDGALSRAMGINIEKAPGAEFGQTTAVTLYFLGQNSDNLQYYVPVTRMIPRTEEKAKATLEQLIAGPANTKLYPVLASSVETPQVETADGVITVNFSESLLGPDHKAPGETIEAVVLSLTENVAADAKVQIEVNGEAKVVTTDNETYNKPVSRPLHLNEVKM
jgi:germination protein M